MPKLRRTAAYFELADRLIREKAERHSPGCISILSIFGPGNCACGTDQAREIVPTSEWLRPDTGPR